MGSLKHRVNQVLLFKRKMMGKVVFIVLMTALISFSFAQEKIQLNELNSPSTIVVSDDYIAIEDGATVKLYNADNFTFIQTIGNEGQGPGEFQIFATPQILEEVFLISSSNKIAFFNFAGDLIKEKRHTFFASPLKAIEDKFVGFVWNFPEDYIAYILYGSDFEPIKELHRGKPLIHPNRRRDLFEIFFYDTYDENIVIAHRDGSGISVFDSKGNMSHLIKPRFNRRPFTKDDKLKLLQYWKEERGYNQAQIESLEKRTDFPDFYPPFNTCRIADGLIYIITYESVGDKVACLIYDINGMFHKRISLPIHMSAPNNVLPFTIKNNKMYQISFNNEQNHWELIVSEIENEG
ncbi:MAG: 6-bladed beta-propeller [Candidatus Aminicenantes bacterium]|nr:6-bladed beta-propeller [Candidatus Aminicenantes bacterium]